jgi:hypothetical protein
MKKLQLNLDDLSVDSFHASGEDAGGRGTVHGRNDSVFVACDDTNDVCVATGYYTCDVDCIIESYDTICNECIVVDPTLYGEVCEVPNETDYNSCLVCAV